MRENKIVNAFLLSLCCNSIIWKRDKYLMSGYKSLIDYCPITSNHYLPPPILSIGSITFIERSVILLTVGSTKMCFSVQLCTF